MPGTETIGGTLASERMSFKKDAHNDTRRADQTKYLEVVDGEMLQLNNQKQVDASEEIRRLSSEVVDSSDSDEFDYDSGDRKKTGEDNGPAT